VKVKAVDEQFYPEEIYAMILHKTKETAAAFLKKPVTKAVITVPALFGDTQRTAIKNAGKIAGRESIFCSGFVLRLPRQGNLSIYVSSFLFYL